MLASVRRNRRKSDLSPSDRQDESRLVRGEFDPSQKLRECHLDVEMSATDPIWEHVAEKCRETCREADRMLTASLVPYKKEVIRERENHGRRGRRGGGGS